MRWDEDEEEEEKEEEEEEGNAVFVNDRLTYLCTPLYVFFSGYT